MKIQPALKHAASAFSSFTATIAINSEFYCLQILDANLMACFCSWNTMDSAENHTRDPTHLPVDESETHAPAAAASEGAHSQSIGPSGSFFGLRKNQLYFGGVGMSSYFEFSAVIFKWLQVLLRMTIGHTTLPILMVKKCPKMHEYGLSVLKKRQILMPTCWQSGGIPLMSCLFLCILGFLSKFDV